MKHILSIQWRERPDMTIAVDWDVKHQNLMDKAAHTACVIFSLYPCKVAFLTWGFE